MFFFLSLSSSFDKCYLALHTSAPNSQVLPTGALIKGGVKVSHIAAGDGPGLERCVIYRVDVSFWPNLFRE